MPNFDGTGPRGLGPLTGRGRGQGMGVRVGRPRSLRCVGVVPNATFFKPRGIPMVDLEIEPISIEELEAIRLCYVEDMDQNAVAEKMQTSQSTVQRLIASANKKVATALTEGKAIEVQS